MISFREPLCTSVRYKGRRYILRPSFDRVISAYKILEDERFTEAERIDIALSFVIDGKYPIDGNLLTAIFTALQALPKTGGDDDETVTDFDYDAPYIYGAFMQTYGIDLFEQRGILHWQKFVALFASLPQNTKFADIIKFRTEEVPKITQANRKQVEALMKAKAFYRLPVKNPEKNFENGLKKMIMSLRK